MKSGHITTGSFSSPRSIMLQLGKPMLKLGIQSYFVDGVFAPAGKGETASATSICLEKIFGLGALTIVGTGTLPSALLHGPRLAAMPRNEFSVR